MSTQLALTSQQESNLVISLTVDDAQNKMTQLCSCMVPGILPNWPSTELGPNWPRAKPTLNMTLSLLHRLLLAVMVDLSCSARPPVRSRGIASSDGATGS